MSTSPIGGFGTYRLPSQQFECAVGIHRLLIGFGFGLLMFLSLMIIPTFLWIANREQHRLRKNGRRQRI
ncbi:MAG: hypothetical protein ACE5OY_06465 [Candidatus Bathyarchaeia archaeon]